MTSNSNEAKNKEEAIVRLRQNRNNIKQEAETLARKIRSGNKNKHN